MEKRDLYDFNRNKTGFTINKDDDIPNNYFILMVVIFIQNENNEFLIQKRSKEKGGDWAFTGGHPKAGESSLEGIITEVNEELGILINDPVCFKNASGKNTFCDLYYLKQDVKLSSIKLVDGEVDEVKYATIDEIEQLYLNGEFKKGHYMMFKDCLNYINNR